MFFLFLKVKVELNFGGDSNLLLSYPADKVWRLNAVDGQQNVQTSDTDPWKEIKFSVR